MLMSLQINFIQLIFQTKHGVRKSREKNDLKSEKNGLTNRTETLLESCINMHTPSIAITLNHNILNRFNFHISFILIAMYLEVRRHFYRSNQLNDSATASFCRWKRFCDKAKWKTARKLSIFMKEPF